MNNVVVIYLIAILITFMKQTFNHFIIYCLYLLKILIFFKYQHQPRFFNAKEANNSAFYVNGKLN